MGHKNMICWLEKPDMNADETFLRGIPRDLDRRLYKDLWREGIPVILTSGTLSAAGDFSRVKRTLGLDLTYGVTETSKPSPFDYHNNALIYVSENVPFPDTKNAAYITAVANETERLVKAAHGHAAVLFTSYKAMDMVWEKLSARSVPFPLFRLDKGGIAAIERYKRSGNGVLFASGALWEGIDIPGDALSLLIIVRLPFAVPDPISDYERARYADMDEYKAAVVVPDMLLKLKQGFGRLIRTMTDTGAAAILDYRARPGGPYRAKALDALPRCVVTASIADVEAFIRQKKAPEYFA
jgi:ATP-dependent DNA helicase DinG